MVKPITIPISYRSDPKGLRQAEKDLKGLAGGIGKAIAGATAVVAGIGIASIKAFADFDQAMNKSLAIMGNVSDTLRGDMSDAAREVAKTTTFSAEEAAESFFFLASAGLDAEASIAALPSVAGFAQAGMFDMSTATDLLTDAQSALGLSSDDAAENLENMVGLSDVLVKANTLANASVEQFSTALTTKAATAMQTFGVELETGVAALAIFADQGIKGEAAGTRLDATLLGLSRTAIQNADAYDDLGVAVFDSEGNFRNLADITEDLEVAFDGMSTEQKQVELMQLGLNKQALAGTLALVGQSGALKDFESDLVDAGGTTEEVAENQLQTLNAQLGILGDIVKDVGIEIGDELGPVMEDLVEELKPVIEEIGDALIPAFKEMTPAISTLVGALPGLISALVPVLPVMIDIAAVMLELAIQLLPIFLEIIALILPGLSDFTQFLVDNSDAVAIAAIVIGGMVLAFSAFNTVARIGALLSLGFAAAKGTATVAVKLFNAALRANPLGIVITLVTALIGGLILFFTQTETGKKAWAAFTDFLLLAWNGFKDGFFFVLDAVGAFFKTAINGYIGMFEGFVNFFISGINMIIRGLNQIKVDLPGTPFSPPLTIGVNIPTIPKLNLPRLADGGIVKRRPGGILANIGEGRFDEAVIPLDGKTGLGGNTFVVNINANVADARLGEVVVNAIKRYERTSGPVFASA